MRRSPGDARTKSSWPVSSTISSRVGGLRRLEVRAVCRLLLEVLHTQRTAAARLARAVRVAPAATLVCVRLGPTPANCPCAIALLRGPRQPEYRVAKSLREMPVGGLSLAAGLLGQIDALDEAIARIDACVARAQTLTKAPPAELVASS